MTPTGLPPRSLPSLNTVANSILCVLYANMPFSTERKKDKQVPEALGNQQIAIRYITGGTLEEIAADCGISPQHVYRIVNSKQK